MFFGGERSPLHRLSPARGTLGVIDTIGDCGTSAVSSSPKMKKRRSKEPTNSPVVDISSKENVQPYIAVFIHVREQIDKDDLQSLASDDSNNSSNWSLDSDNSSNWTLNSNNLVNCSLCSNDILQELKDEYIERLESTGLPVDMVKIFADKICAMGYSEDCVYSQGLCGILEDHGRKATSVLGTKTHTCGMTACLCTCTIL